MPRGQKPLDPDGGPLAAFAHDLRLLREQANSPPYRTLAKRARFSASTLSVAASGAVLPSLDVTLAYVQGCGGDPEQWQARWRELAAERASVSTAPPPDALRAASSGPAQLPSPPVRPPRYWRAAAAVLIVLGGSGIAAVAISAATRPTQRATANTTPAAAGYRYDQTIGPGCPDAPKATISQDNSSAAHEWTQTTARSWPIMKPLFCCQGQRDPLG
jgi:hypothetical protein